MDITHEFFSHSSMKRLLAPLIEPVGAFWLLITLGAVWLLWRRQWRSAAWLGARTLLLFMLGSTPLAEMLVGGSMSGVDGCEP
jgi:hypothetical protein